MQKTRLTIIGRISCVLFAVLLLFSICFEVLESDHQCSGEDCPICKVIQIVRQNIKLFGLILATVAVCSGKLEWKRSVSASFESHSDMANTLFIQKTRLND